MAEQDIYHNPLYSRVIEYGYNKVRDINWGTVGKYAVLIALGAAVGAGLGKICSGPIADLISVESTFMGVEKAIATERIAQGCIALGGLVGAGSAFVHSKLRKRNLESCLE